MTATASASRPIDTRNLEDVAVVSTQTMDRNETDVLGRFLHRQDEHSNSTQEEHESSEGVVRVSPSSVVASSARRRVADVPDGSKEVGITAELRDKHPRDE
jgi:hypothetical protein